MCGDGPGIDEEQDRLPPSAPHALERRRAVAELDRDSSALIPLQRRDRENRQFRGDAAGVGGGGDVDRRGLVRRINADRGGLAGLACCRVEVPGLSDAQGGGRRPSRGENDPRGGDGGVPFRGGADLRAGSDEGDARIPFDGARRPGVGQDDGDVDASGGAVRSAQPRGELAGSACCRGGVGGLRR